jgi:hypothetical protein
MTSSTIAQRQKDALATLDFDASGWTFAEAANAAMDVHDVLSRYVEELWLPVLGPTCTVMLRHLGVSLWRDGTFSVSLTELPHRFGLGSSSGPNSLLGRSMARLIAFELAELSGRKTLMIKTVLPWLTDAQVARLHPALQFRHRRWVDQHPTVSPY